MAYDPQRVLKQAAQEGVLVIGTRDSQDIHDPHSYDPKNGRESFELPVVPQGIGRATALVMDLLMPLNTDEKARAGVKID